MTAVSGNLVRTLEETPNADGNPIAVQMKAKLTDYESAFRAYSDARLKSAELFDKHLRPDVISTQQSLAAAQSSLKDDFEAAGKATRALVANTTLNQELLAASGLVLGVVLAFLIGRGIANPVTAMTAAMRRLGGQDMAVEIPGVGRHDEIDAMAAVQVFKDNALLARTLEREQAEAQQRWVSEDQRVRREAELAAAAEAAVLVVGSIGLGWSGWPRVTSPSAWTPPRPKRTRRSAAT